MRSTLTHLLLGAVALTGIATLSGCMYGHDHDHDRDYGHPAGYREHDEHWDREHGHDMDRHDVDRHDRADYGHRD